MLVNTLVNARKHLVIFSFPEHNIWFEQVFIERVQASSQSTKVTQPPAWSCINYITCNTNYHQTTIGYIWYNITFYSKICLSTKHIVTSERKQIILRNVKIKFSLVRLNTIIIFAHKYLLYLVTVMDRDCNLALVGSRFRDNRRWWSMTM